MSTEAEKKMVTISVLGKQYVLMDEYYQLSKQASLMEQKLKAMENIQELLRQKDLEVRKCKNTIKHYQMALHRSERRLVEAVHTITRILETKDRYRKEQTCEVKDELDQNKGFCLPYVDVDGKLVQELNGMTVASDVLDASSVLAQSPSFSRVSATSTFEDSHCSVNPNAGDQILEATELQNSAELLAINPQKFQHETGTLLMEDSCGQDINLKDEGKKEIVSRLICLNVKSNQQRDKQRPVFHSPNVSSMSKDLLNKLMQQNARLKKALKDVLSCSGTSVEHYLDREELKDTITQLRQQLTESTQQTAELRKKIRITEEMK